MLKYKHTVTPLFKCNEATTEHNNIFEWRLWPCHHDEHELLTKNVICAQNSGLKSYISLQSSLSIFAQKYLCKYEDTYFILHNKYLCIYKDSFGVNILGDLILQLLGSSSDSGLSNAKDWN